jgi:predicted alpha-1,6-mannanase (GH76 family)
LFYDDNAHIAVALAQAYTLTKDPVYLTRAVQTYNFVLSGEDSAGGGGIYFKVNDSTSKNTISTLQAVRAALLLYQITGTSKYLTDATRLYAWSKTHVQQSNGLFKEGYSLTGADAGTAVGYALTNGAGIGLLCNIEFYRATGDLAYLREAQRIAQASRSAYFNSSTGALNDEGYWTFELVEGLDEL